MKNLPFYRRMSHALDGMRVVWQTESSFRTECLIAVVTIAVTAALRPGWLWAAFIAICIAFVLAMELVNSALEYLMDHVHPDIAAAIKHAKDAAAGAVLMAGIGAAAVALFMLASVYFK
jgi:diacylglycerol kinase (ATP)